MKLVLPESTLCALSNKPESPQNNNFEQQMRKMQDTEKKKLQKQKYKNTKYITIRTKKTKYNNNKYRTPLSPSTHVADPGLAGVAKRLQYKKR